MIDIICYGCLMEINYKESESNIVGNKIDYVMHSMNFEELLWQKDIKILKIEDIYSYMIE